MDEYLSDKEQVERLRQWWRENGWFLVGGVALGALGIYGYYQYFAFKDRQSEAAAALYESVRQATEDADVAQAGTLLAQLRADHPAHAYTDQAALLLARAELVSAPERAVEELRTTMAASRDPELAMIARIRLARVLAYREQYGEALALLDVPSAGQFAGYLNEVKGDIHVARGETDAARTAYLAALVAPGSELLDRNFLQIKLGDLPGAVASEPMPVAAPAAPSGDPAEAGADAPADAVPGDGA